MAFALGQEGRHVRPRLVVVVAILLCCTRHAAAAPHPQDSTVGKLEACWVMNRAIVMVGQVAQLHQAHELMLQPGASGAPSAVPLPVQLRAYLHESQRNLAELRQWFQLTGVALAKFFTAAQTDEHGAFEAVVSQPLSFLAAPELQHQQWKQQQSPDGWKQLCADGILLDPLMTGLETLAAEHDRIEAQVEEAALRTLELRTDRASAAGSLEAYEQHVGALKSESNSTARAAKAETISGVFLASSDVDKALWRDETLKRQASLLLRREMRIARQQHERLVQEQDADFLVQEKQESVARLKKADAVLLADARSLLDLVQRRDDAAQAMRVHLKSVLAQCFPTSATAPRSRYARFASSSPAANAVQLGFEVSRLLRLASSIVPAFQTVARSALADARKGVGHRFRAAPTLARWWEWLPNPAEDTEQLAVGYGAFMKKFQTAEAAFDNQLAEGGYLAALHSMWVQWRNLDGSIMQANRDDAIQVQSESVVAAV